MTVITIVFQMKSLVCMNSESGTMKSSEDHDDAHEY